VVLITKSSEENTAFSKNTSVNVLQNYDLPEVSLMLSDVTLCFLK